jgi:dTDP-glucose 4,6-dehydratase
MMSVLVTGGAGFIGSHFVRLLLKQHREEVIVLDKLTYAGNMANLTDLQKDTRFTFVKGDICDEQLVESLASKVESIVNFAAESHVDRSITHPEDFVRSNITGPYTLLEAARKHDLRYLQISTDEVYGSILKGSFSEEDPLKPSSPYSASKAAGDLLAHAYFRTYGLNAVVTRSSNNYGPNQHPEKFIPLTITNASKNKPIPVYGDGMNVRDWLYVTENCDAIDLVRRKGRKGEIYNIASGNELINLEVAKTILKILQKPESLLNFTTDRPGHDRRYSLNRTKTTELGFKPRITFEEGLKRTIDWYTNNQKWLETVTST